MTPLPVLDQAPEPPEAIGLADHVVALLKQAPAVRDGLRRRGLDFSSIHDDHAAWLARVEVLEGLNLNLRYSNAGYAHVMLGTGQVSIHHKAGDFDVKAFPSTEERDNEFVAAKIGGHDIFLEPGDAYLLALEIIAAVDGLRAP